MNLKAYKESIFIIVTLFIFQNVTVSQDTLWTKILNYNSVTRDTLVQFPNGDHSQYEKILMYYSMRCKKGLVSTTSNRNLGCGEWDYSCNTNIIDSSGVDSLKATHPNYIIAGYNELYFPYTIQPTYTLFDFESKSINLNSPNIESVLPVGDPNNAQFIAVKDINFVKAYYIFNKSELSSLSNGNINGLRLTGEGLGDIDHFICKVAKTTEDDMTLQDIENLSYINVYQRKVTGQNGQMDLIFHRPYPYITNNHLVLEISYFGNASRLKDMSLSFEQTPENTSFSNVNDHYLQMGSQGVAKLPSENMTNINEEISISFWSRGNSQILPNSNSIFYATDSAGNRQLNVHLPWSNGRVFWDCGFSSGNFDRIDKNAISEEYVDNWNHWVFTKNAATGSMKIYLNGGLWHSSTGKSKKIKIDHFYLGGSENGDLLYNGDVDDFCVWNKELSVSEIGEILKQNPSDEGPLFNHLVAHYNMNHDENSTIFDQSAFQASAIFPEKIARKRFSISEIFKGYSSNNNRLQIGLIKGTFNLTTTDGNIRDSVPNTPFKVTEYEVVNGNISQADTRYLWLAGSYPVFNENGEIIDETEFQEDDIILVEPLTYYRKFPAKYELLSFVTPYGIGIDFGQGGKTWIFDVTDYGPVLKGQKRFLMDKGGEWQEEMDIKFAFIKGIPVRPVLSLQQIWPVESYGYTSILGNQHLEPRTLKLEPEVKSMKIRTVATGHGQEGEFIPRTHSLLVRNTNYSWQLWKECADNPVYPQGGTWVYDRAGWCPGAPSDLREFEIMENVGNSPTFIVDYGINTASGDSRYIVNTQLVKYGNISFQNDASLEEIISPSTSIVNFRKNPICANPEIVVRNTGQNPLTKILLSYRIDTYETRTFEWTGNLPFLKTTHIVLPDIPVQEILNGGLFKVWIESVNETDDEYIQNNTKETSIAKARHMDEGIIVSMRTNGAPHETSWTLKDEQGLIIKQSRSNLTANTMYNDTIRNLNGCFTLQFFDTDDDGIAWWANGDGNGFIRAKGILDNAFMVFQPDFGREFTFHFFAGQITSTVENTLNIGLNIAPNPVYDKLTVQIVKGMGNGNLSIWTQSGQHQITKTIFSDINNDTNVTFDVSQYPPGLYFVRYADEFRTTVKKFIKM